MDSKKLFLEIEGDNYYERNKSILINDIGVDTVFYASFLSNIVNENTNIVEIGAGNGRNINYFRKVLNCSVSGIEPSSKAVHEGNQMFFNNHPILIKGTSDALPYEDESVDVVLFGFSLFWVGRKYLFRSIAEADRILKERGYLLITDFDTYLPYKRLNIHNKDAWTYKMDYSKLFLANPQYYLIEKKNYSHSNDFFDNDIQERISAQILFKDYEDNVYVSD